MKSSRYPLLPALVIAMVAALATGSALATRIMFLEQTIEMTRLTDITPLDGSGAGWLTLEDDCERCPDRIPYNGETMLDTPFGANRPITELVEWRGHPAVLHYALPDPVATRIIVRPIGADQ